MSSVRMDENRISYHDSFRKVYESIKKDGMTNIWDRYEAQGIAGDPDKRCPIMVHIEMSRKKLGI